MDLTILEHCEDSTLGLKTGSSISEIVETGKDYIVKKHAHVTMDPTTHEHWELVHSIS